MAAAPRSSDAQGVVVPLDDGDPITERSAKSLVTTLLGEFVLPAGGQVWTATIIDGITPLGFTERNIRQAIGRLGDDGLIESERHGRRARWRLTDDGRHLLTAGTDRIYSFGARRGGWDGTWVLVMCQIPETRRQVRHRFRTRMSFAGYGFLNATTAISPHLDREGVAASILRDLDLDESAVVFRAAASLHTDDASLVAEAWDLASVEREYETFVDTFAPLRSVDPPTAFGRTVLLVDEWRRFPFLDPELPDELLPPGWVGGRAQELFDRCRDTWRASAQHWFAERERAETLASA